MNYFTFQDIAGHFRASANMRRNGCVIADLHSSPENEGLTGCISQFGTCCFILCTTGRMRLSVDMKEYTIRENGLLIIMPRTRIIVHKWDKFAARCLFLHTSCLNHGILPVYYSSSLLVHVMQNPFAQIGLDQRACCIGLLQNIQQIATRSSDSEFSDEAVRNGIAMFLYVLSDMLQSSSGSEYAKPTSANRREVYFYRFIKELSLHYKAQRRIEFYADQLFLTPKYLTTLVRQVSGKSAKKWIDDFVISEASFLLKHDDLSIQQISQEMNFPNQSFFGKFFKEQTGYSPSEFRQIKLLQ